MVVLERLESDPAIQKAHCTFDDLVRDVKQSPFLHSQHVRAWSCFLHVLKAHGGWSTVNDARVSAAAVLKKQERDADRREGARMVRRNRAAARRKAPPPFVATPSFMIALDNEFDRRLGILLDLRSRRDSPRWINKLDSVGCSRTAEVWRARAILTRTGCPPTGSNIAELLLRDSRVEVTPPTTLTTVAYRDLKRIRKLEDNAAGLAIWGAFDPRC